MVAVGVVVTPAAVVPVVVACSCVVDAAVPAADVAIVIPVAIVAIALASAICVATVAAVAAVVRGCYHCCCQFHRTPARLSPEGLIRRRAIPAALAPIVVQPDCWRAHVLKVSSCPSRPTCRSNC